MHLEQKAGDKVFVDFTGEKLHLTDKDSGEVSEGEVLVAILGCRQLPYVEAVYSQRGVYNYPIIVEILARHLDTLDDLQPAVDPMPEHVNIRGAEYYQ